MLLNDLMQLCTKMLESHLLLSSLSIYNLPRSLDLRSYTGKVFALLLSEFRHVLFLDADNMPLQARPAFCSLRHRQINDHSNHSHAPSSVCS